MTKSSRVIHLARSVFLQLALLAIFTGALQAQVYWAKRIGGTGAVPAIALRSTRRPIATSQVLFPAPPPLVLVRRIKLCSRQRLDSRVFLSRSMTATTAYLGQKRRCRRGPRRKSG